MAAPPPSGEVPLVMPKMSMTMTEGIFVARHKQPGDAVRNGDVVAEVTTDKVDMEAGSPVDGVLARLVARSEDVNPVGEPIAWIASDSDDLLGDLLAPPPPPGRAAGSPAVAGPDGPQPAPPPGPPRRRPPGDGRRRPDPTERRRAALARTMAQSATVPPWRARWRRARPCRSSSSSATSTWRPWPGPAAG
jgi:pyruvate dehydrogenase E2 component (dihydrolipoamide acetyltransferase)